MAGLGKNFYFLLNQNNRKLWAEAVAARSKVAHASYVVDDLSLALVGANELQAIIEAEIDGAIAGGWENSQGMEPLRDQLRQAHVDRALKSRQLTQARRDLADALTKLNYYEDITP